MRSENPDSPCDNALTQSLTDATAGADTDQIRDVIAVQTAADKTYAPYGFENDEAKTRERLQRARDLTATVHPVARGLYRVTTDTGSEYMVDLDGYVAGDRRAICECNDYRYRCGPDGVDCKHILFVKRLVRQGMLPPVETDPSGWLEHRLSLLRSLVGARRDTTDNPVVERELDEVTELIDQLEGGAAAREYREVVQAVWQAFGEERDASLSWS